jgi:hypothetical protein
MLLEVEVVLSGDVVAVVHHEEAVILVAEAEDTSSASPRTSFLRVNFLARPTIMCSSAISTLIQTTWEKRKVLMQLCHTPFREIGNEASIRVPRMFKSHAWQQYDKQMQCY